MPDLLAVPNVSTAGDERLSQRPRRPGQGEDGAIVVAIAVAVEQGDASAEGSLQARQALAIASLGEVGSSKQKRHRLRLAARHGGRAAQSSRSPPLTIVAPSISIVGSNTTQSR